MRETKDLRIVDTTALRSPDDVTLELPLSDRAADVVYRSRQEIQAVLDGRDPRKLVIVGPCSIHDPKAALDYAHRLLELRESVKDALLIVMRVYFEKPRTTVGWKGLINDPHLDGSYDIPNGIRVARGLLREIAELGLPAATEMLDPIIPQYIADLVSWTAIGARTTESQTHREMASGLSMPVGFKNGTDGGLGVAINAIISASRPHSFLGVDSAGRVGVVRTAGNPYGHIVLRGGSAGPNYGAAEVTKAVAALKKAKVNAGVMIDASHDNSQKDPMRQPAVLDDVAAQLRAGQQHILGVMLESHIQGGRQDLVDKAALQYGQSITDGCISFDQTRTSLLAFAEAVRSSSSLKATA